MYSTAIHRHSMSYHWLSKQKVENSLELLIYSFLKTKLKVCKKSVLMHTSVYIFFTIPT